MAQVIGDRVRETTTTTGTGALTLAGAVSGYRAFSSVLATGDTTFYVILSGTDWEVGVGTLTASTTLARTTVLSSSNANGLVNFAAGTKDVFIDLPAAKVAPRTRRFALTAAATLGADALEAVVAASGTFTIGFAAAATLGSEWRCQIKNTGTGIVTLDPNGSETIDGLTTVRLYPGEGLTVFGTGTALATVGRPTGPVLISTTTIASAVASVDLETGFDDPEFVKFGLVLEQITQSTSGIVGLRWKQGGAYGATGYTSFDPPGNSLTAGGTLLGLHTSADNSISLSGDFSILSPYSANAAGPRISGVASTITANIFATIFGYRSTAGALQGVRLLQSAGGNLTGGTVCLYGQR